MIKPRPFPVHLHTILILLLCAELIQSEEINQMQRNPECDDYLADEIKALHAQITSLKEENSQLKNKNKLWLHEHYLRKELQNELIHLKTSYTYNDNWDTELHYAVNRQDLDAVKNLIQSGAYINPKNRLLETPLIRAGQATDPAITKYLIENGAEIYPKDVGNRTFLHNLVADKTSLSPSEFHELSKFLVGKNMSKIFNMPGWTGVNTPVLMAVKNLAVSPITLQLLHDNGVDLNQVSTTGDSIFVYALLGQRDKDLFAELVKLGVNWRYVDQFNRSLLHVAAAYCYEEGVRFFLGLGLDVNGKDGWDDTPLNLAVQFGREGVLETVRLLVEQGADGGIRNNRGETPLDEVMLREDMINKDEVVKYLQGK